MNWYTPFVILAFSTFVLLGNYSETSSQDLYQPILTVQDAFNNASWSLDSSEFSFQVDSLTNGVHSQTDSWYDYHIDTQQLLRSNSWPFQPALTQAQQTTFAVAMDTDGQTSFMFASPNKRFVVYASQHIGYEFGLAIADLQNNTHVVVSPIILAGFVDFERSLDVRWSADSSAFIVQTDRLMGGSDHTYYVTNFVKSLDVLTVHSLDDGISFGSQITYTVTVLAISSDGNAVLLADYKSNAASIFVWNVVQPSQSQEVTVGGVFVPGATFVPGRPTRIRFIGPSGLTEYDLKNKQATILDTLINTSWVTKAWFAPDGNNIALIKALNSRIDFYIIPIYLRLSI